MRMWHSIWKETTDESGKTTVHRDKSLFCSFKVNTCHILAVDMILLIEAMKACFYEAIIRLLGIRKIDTTKSSDTAAITISSYDTTVRKPVQMNLKRCEIAMQIKSEIDITDKEKRIGCKEVRLNVVLKEIFNFYDKPTNYSMQPCPWRSSAYCTLKSSFHDLAILYEAVISATERSEWSIGDKPLSGANGYRESRCFRLRTGPPLHCEKFRAYVYGHSGAP